MEQDAAKEEEKGASAPGAADMDLDQFLDGGFMVAAGSDDEELMSSDDSLDGEDAPSDEEEEGQFTPSAGTSSAAADDSSSEGEPARSPGLRRPRPSLLACLTTVPRRWTFCDAGPARQHVSVLLALQVAALMTRLDFCGSRPQNVSSLTSRSPPPHGYRKALMWRRVGGR